MLILAIIFGVIAVAIASIAGFFWLLCHNDPGDEVAGMALIVMMLDLVPAGLCALCLLIHWL